MKTMVAIDPNKTPTVIHHESTVYKPKKNGSFEVDESHVTALRSHGLKVEGEVTAEEHAATVADQTAENERLRKLLAEAGIDPATGKKAK